MYLFIYVYWYIYILKCKFFVFCNYIIVTSRFRICSATPGKFFAFPSNTSRWTQINTEPPHKTVSTVFIIFWLRGVFRWSWCLICTFVTFTLRIIWKVRSVPSYQDRNWIAQLYKILLLFKVCYLLCLPFRFVEALALWTAGIPPLECWSMLFKVCRSLRLNFSLIFSIDVEALSGIILLTCPWLPADSDGCELLLPI